MEKHLKKIPMLRTPALMIYLVNFRTTIKDLQEAVDYILKETGKR